MKEVLIKSSSQGVKKTFHEALEDPSRGTMRRWLRRTSTRRPLRPQNPILVVGCERARLTSSLDSLCARVLRTDSQLAGVAQERPIFDLLRSKPRFVALMRKTRFDK
jgi:hypothetical protein